MTPTRFEGRLAWEDPFNLLSSPSYLYLLRTSWPRLYRMKTFKTLCSILIFTFGARAFSTIQRFHHRHGRGLFAKEDENVEKENIFTLLNPFKQAPSATKREKEEYKRKVGSTPKTTTDSTFHMAERKKFSFGSKEQFEINAYKKKRIADDEQN